VPDTLSITDNRTGQTIEVAVDQYGAFNASELKKLGLLSFDQPLLATATARSSITFIDGDAGILRYRGYPIEQLAEKTTFLEVAYLLANGELPTAAQRKEFDAAVLGAKVDSARIAQHVASFPSGSHPMSVLISGYAALGAAHQEAKAAVGDGAARKAAMPLQLAETLQLGAQAIAASVGKKAGAAEGDTYAAQFIAACGGAVDVGGSAERLDVFSRALEVLFILHADHELNAGTNAMRAVGSAETDAYSSLAGASAALYGPLHGGANEAVLKMLDEIGDIKNIPAFIKRVKEKDGQAMLMGFGHRVYKNYDPRAKLIQKTCHEVLEELDMKDNKLIKLAMELERIALSDDYFIKRKLYPNVDFYSGIVYKALGIPVSMYTAIFALARTVGWIAQWKELISDPEQKLSRPRQLFTGATTRDFVPMGKRK
jgi:citrate synthase